MKNIYRIINIKFFNLLRIKNKYQRLKINYCFIKE